MASPSEATPLVLELEDIFDEEDFVGPPGEAVKLQASRATSNNVQSLGSRRSTRTSSRLPPPTADDGENHDSDNGISNANYGHPAVLYTPAHPSNIKTPSRRGRPPKNAAAHNSLGAGGPPRHFPSQIVNLPQRITNQPMIRQRNPALAFARMDNPSSSTPDNNQQWAPTLPQTRFGGLPSFHTSLGNGIRQAVPRQPMPAHAVNHYNGVNHYNIQQQQQQPPYPHQQQQPPYPQQQPPYRHQQQPPYPQQQPTYRHQQQQPPYPQQQPTYRHQQPTYRHQQQQPPYPQQQQAPFMNFQYMNHQYMAMGPQYTPVEPLPEPKKPPTEDDITKQDNDIEASQDEEYHEAETYSDYTPSKLMIGQPHPDPVVETSSLATVEPPDVTYELRLPNNVIQNCLLSALQLESVVYASQQHEQYLADGKSRRGFLIGDGAGIGKGRTIAGIIYENFLAGRRKSVWLSVSPDLKLDAERDLRDIGAKHIPVNNVTKHGYGKKIEVAHGVIFATYTGLVSKSQSLKGALGSRLGQLVSWLGPDFDGVIVFDECHKAKNISIGAKKPTKTAEAVLEFQNQLPGARVVYASATGASETRHLGYMTRLGLWGEGTPYEECKDFCTAIEKRGVGAMELVAVDLKMRGSYIARQLSFKTTSFDIRIAELDDKFVALYDRCVELWSRAFHMFTEACNLFEREGAKVPKKVWMCFWSAHQKFFKYLCIGAKVPLVVEIAKKALADGKCVVIGLQSTGDAKTQEALEEGEITEFISTARATFESLVENHFLAPPRSRTPSEPKLSPPSMIQDQDTQGSSTDLSSTTVIDETFHSHEVVKFCSENGLASAELEEDKAAYELRQSSSKARDAVRELFKKKTKILQELAKKTVITPAESRKLRAKKRAKARDTRQSRIKKPIDESETEVSTPTTSEDLSTDPSNDADDTSSDESYRLSDDATLQGSSTDEGESDRTKIDDDDEDDISPAPAKRSKPAERLNSDSDSDIEITAVKQKTQPRARRCEVIILSSDDEEEEDDDESISMDPLKIHGAKLSAMRDELLKMVADIGSDLPNNTLDELIDQLGGPDCVAEMTGRKGRLVKDEDGAISYRQRNEADALECMNIAEKERFMKGDKLVAIISEAASSGISLQADRRAGNQLRRVHITIELPWSADRAVQQFGRTHRSNQVSGPEYVFVISELSGEKRFASVVAKRLESLGALTHGDRRATTESRDLSQFNLSGRFCRQAIERIVDYLECGFGEMKIKPNYEGDFLQDAVQAFVDTGLGRMVYGRLSADPAVFKVDHFLNRLLGMKVRMQNSMFQLFTDYMDRLIARKKISGEYDSGILELNSESGKTTCFPPEDYYLKTKAGIVKCTLRNVQVERGISWDEAKALYDDSNTSNPDDRSGFYIYPVLGGTSKTISLLLREPESVDLFRVFRPNTGRIPKPDLFDILGKGRTKYTLNQASKLWQKIYEFTAQKCVHLCFFDHCKRREAKLPCNVGLRHSNYCILSGGILTAWPYLEKKSSNITEKVRIVRLRLDANNRVIGPIIPQHFVDRVRLILEQGARETVVF